MTVVTRGAPGKRRRVPRSVLRRLEGFRQHLRDVGRSENTVKNYTGCIARMILSVGEVRANAKAEQWFFETSRPLAPGSKNSLLAALHAYREYKGYTPLKISFFKLPQRLPKALEQPEIDRILELQSSPKTHAERQDRLLFEILYGSGLRRHEAGILRIGHVRNKDVLAIIGKGNKERKAPITDSAFTYLRDWVLRYEDFTGEDMVRETKKDLRFFELRDQSPELPIFVDSDGDPVCEHTAPGCWVYKRLARYGVSPHSLRHTWATELISNGADSFSVKNAGGWSSMTTMQGYIKSLDKEVRNVKQFHPRQRS